MKLKYFSKVDFWAREFRLPLFWITDPNHKIFAAGALVLYKNNVIHIYHLDDTEAKLSEKGYKYFSDKSNVINYKKRVREIRNLIKRETDSYKELKVNKLNTVALKNKVFKLIGSLDLYSNTYTRTEPIALSKIEANEKKYRILIKELGEMRLILRKEGERLFYNLFGVFLKETAKRFDLKFADMFLYKLDELNKLFSGQKVRPSIIAERKMGYAVICLKGKKIILTGGKFKELYKDIVLTKPKTEQLQGRAAMAGKVKGRVRVILHNKRNITKEVMNFGEGEILVTEMTRPDTILACKKAAAIITDEGGITSHAAIISRELKIPCVVATKIATQILKTGDLVEVDADNGFIKILKAG